MCGLNSSKREIEDNKTGPVDYDILLKYLKAEINSKEIPPLLLNNWIDNFEEDLKSNTKNMDELNQIDSFLKEILNLPPIIPKQNSPVKDLRKKALLSIQGIAYTSENFPQQEIKPHPASDYFPGKLSVSPDSILENRVKLKLIVNPITGLNWIRTGYYALPGEPLKVSLRMNQFMWGTFKLQIGCHNVDLRKLNTDPKWGRAWLRCPRITVAKEINFTHNQLKQNVEIWSPFGGLIYITHFSEKVSHTLNKFGISKVFPAGKWNWNFVFPTTQEDSDGILEVEMKGSFMPAPYFDCNREPEELMLSEICGFELPRISWEEWRQQLKNCYVPWVEIETKSFVVTLPTANAFKMANPETPLQYLEDICKYLQWTNANVGSGFQNKFRIVADLQHSNEIPLKGQPDEPISYKTYLNWIHLDAIDHIFDITKLTSPSYFWNLYVQIALHFQSQFVHCQLMGPPNVTANLSVLYAYDRMRMKRDYTGKNLMQIHRKAVKKYKQNGLKYEEWRQNMDLVLCTYLQLASYYGWSLFEKTLGMSETCVGELNEDEQIQRWVRILTTAARENLGPFFNSWGFPDKVTQISSGDDDKSLGTVDSKLRMNDIFDEDKLSQLNSRLRRLWNEWHRQVYSTLRRL